MKKGSERHRGRIRVPGPLLAAGVVLLLAGGAAALQTAKGAPLHGAGPYRSLWWLFGAVFFGAGIGYSSKLRPFKYTSQTHSEARTRLVRGAIALAVTTAVALPVAFLLLKKQQNNTQPLPLCSTDCPTQALNPTGPIIFPTPQSTATAPATPSTVGLDNGLIVVGLVLAILIVIGLAVVLVRFASGRRDYRPIAGLAPEPPTDDAVDDAALSDALLAGRGALDGEARAAIIACYAAMEASLTTAGVPRLASDSPSDLLSRAAARGALTGPAPVLLAELFREARYSTHPLSETHLVQARGALDEATAQLTARHEAAAATKSRAGGHAVGGPSATAANGAAPDATDPARGPRSGARR